MLPIIGVIASTVGSIFTSWMKTRSVKAEGKIKIAAAKIEARVAKEAAKANMDLAAMDGMRYSWKDEYLVILLTMPVIACFIPDFTLFSMSFKPALAMANGFDVLKTNTPDWYKWALTGMIAATFGLRTFKGWNK